MLRYDSRERDFAVSVNGRADVLYGREKAGGDGGRWLQYWLYYEYNAQDRGVVRTGRHEGDWEFAQVRLDKAGRPDRITLAQHSWAESCGWEEVERRGGAPVLYVANGSHATYLRAGTKDRPFPDPNDEANGAAVRPGPRWPRLGRGCGGVSRGARTARAGCRVSSRARSARPSRMTTVGAIPRPTTPPRTSAGPRHPGAPGRRL